MLELGCGTGRMTSRLEGPAAPLVGLDRSAPMLAIARRKAPTIRWIEEDMRDFQPGETFGLILIPGRTFQHRLTPADQLRCLAWTFSHLNPDGTLVNHLDHQDLPWWARLPDAVGSRFEPAPEIVDARGDNRYSGRMATTASAGAWRGPTGQAHRRPR